MDAGVLFLSTLQISRNSKQPKGLISLYYILVFCASSIKWTGFSEVLGKKNIQATLSTEMLVCNESFSVPCWTREEAILCLQDRSDRGHGSLSEQAVTILQWMNFYWLNPWDQQLAWIFVLLLLWWPNFSHSQNSWTKNLPGNSSNVFGRCGDYYFIHFLLHVWFLPDEMHLWPGKMQVSDSNSVLLNQGVQISWLWSQQIFKGWIQKVWSLSSQLAAQWDRTY